MTDILARVGVYAKLDTLAVNANMQTEYVRGNLYAITEFRRRWQSNQRAIDIILDMRKPIDDRIAKKFDLSAWESGYMDYIRQIKAIIEDSDMV